jgi:hypothetical protein
MARYRPVRVATHRCWVLNPWMTKRRLGVDLPWLGAYARETGRWPRKSLAGTRTAPWGAGKRVDQPW